ncbi:hypothetical protein PInf_008965 [Phytophthora infestans]|nr:hypothetical protein PInf_008965 [Phytophthora infestans]
MTQCPNIHVRDIDKFIPSNVKVGMEEDDAEDCELLREYFSSDSEKDIEDSETGEAPGSLYGLSSGVEVFASLFLVMNWAS